MLKCSYCFTLSQLSNGQFRLTLTLTLTLVVNAIDNELLIKNEVKIQAHLSAGLLLDFVSIHIHEKSLFLCCTSFTYMWILKLKFSINSLKAEVVCGAIVFIKALFTK